MNRNVYRVVRRVIQVLEALYWFARRRFTLRQTWRVITGKAHITYRDYDESEMWKDIYDVP